MGTMQDKLWEIKDPEQYLKPQKKNKPASPPRIEKDPARAYTLSLLFWGAGQGYNEEHGKSLFFELLLIALIVCAVVAGIFHESLLLFLKSRQIPPSRTFLFIEVLFFSLLVLWLTIAGDAYRTAARTRRSRFPGMQHRVYPCLASLAVPGWGQFLNGQPLKGSFFSAAAAFGLFALVSIPLTLFFWPSLDPSDERFIVESIFTIAVLYAPFIPFLWVLGAYDALKVSLEELKKEPLWERIKATNNRRRTQGWVRGVFPQVRYTLVLVLCLGVLILLLSRVFPSGFYTGLLTTSSSHLSRMGMVVLPDLLDRAVPVVAEIGNRTQ